MTAVPYFTIVVDCVCIAVNQNHRSFDQRTFSAAKEILGTRRSTRRSMNFFIKRNSYGVILLLLL